MIGIGSRPVSAIRPAKTETKPAGPSASQLADLLDLRRAVISAVTFTLTPSAGERSRDARPIGSPCVVVTGTLTNTFSPQDAISRACRSISPSSSAMTSNEIGRSGTSSSSSRAKRLVVVDAGLAHQRRVGREARGSRARAQSALDARRGRRRRRRS